MVEAGGFLYDSDSCADEFPYWDTSYGQSHLVVPCTIDCNDARYTATPGFVTSENFSAYLKETFEFLYSEGETGPRVMSVGLHCRLSGRPARAARAAALRRFLDFVVKHDGVWICRRVDIARHWHAHHPPSEARP